ncbi:MAG: polyprenyl synthetase family protein [Alphaproteobacteria bacterium]
MQTQLVKGNLEKSAQENPLETLSDLLENDMDQVNSLIIRYMQSDVALIPQLAQYLIAAGGKRIRPLLTLASTAIFNGSMEKAYYLAAAVEFIHTATLLHDDVVDESFERRGQKTANLIFGNQASVLVGDFLFSKSFQMMVESGSLEILKILSEASAVIAQGEVLQLATTNDIETKMPAYLDVIESKTAALFAASCEVGAVLSEQDRDTITALRTYGMKLGTAFQIIDDALDYNADQEKLGKEIGDDFKEGKMTAPIIFAMEHANPEEMTFWKRTLGEKQQTEDDFASAMAILARHNALEQTVNLAKQYAKDANACLDALPEGIYKILLKQLPDYTITRNF